MKQDSFLTQHLHDANESYFEHLGFTIKFAATLIVIAFIALTHGLMPFLFTHTASTMLCKLMDEAKARKAQCEKGREERLCSKSADNT
jgi:hypothetical protein